MLKSIASVALLLLAAGQAHAQRTLDRPDCLDSHLFKFTQIGAPDHKLSIKVMAWADGAFQVPLVSKSSGEASVDQRAVAVLGRCRFSKVDAPEMKAPDEMELHLAFDSDAVNEASTRKYYEHLAGLRQGLNEYRSYLITVTSQGDAETLLKQLKDGADFEELARRSMKGDKGRYGGSLGWVTISTVERALGLVLYQTKAAGLHPKVIRLRESWGVLLVDDLRQAQMPEFEDVKHRLREYLLRNDGVEASIARSPATPAKE